MKAHSATQRAAATLAAKTQHALSHGLPPPEQPFDAQRFVIVGPNSLVLGVCASGDVQKTCRRFAKEAGRNSVPQHEDALGDIISELPERLYSEDGDGSDE